MSASVEVFKVDGIFDYPPYDVVTEYLSKSLLTFWEQDKKFIILSGPPGVGKSRATEDFLKVYSNRLGVFQKLATFRILSLFPDYMSKIYADGEIDDVLNLNQVEFVWEHCILHSQYAYEDMIRGYRVASGENNALVVREGILGFISRVVKRLENMKPNEKIKGILVLDEINRAPIGQLFGEALYALEKRGMPVSTPYSLNEHGNSFEVPKSLFVLGTMNSVDRSVSSFDFALRRRFSVINLTPSRSAIENSLLKFESDARASVLKLYDNLHNFIINSEQLGIVPKIELCLGHSFFIPSKKISDKTSLLKWLVSTYLYQIIPILMDYAEQGLLEFDFEKSNIPAIEILKGVKNPSAEIEEEILRYLALP